MIIYNFLLNAYFLFFIGLFATDYSFIFSKPISNIAPQTGIFGTFVLVRWFLNKESFQNILFIKGIKRIAKLPDKQILLVIFAFLSGLLISVSLTRHFALSSTAYDLGIFDQAIWNTANGNGVFACSIRGMSLLADHFEPILFLLVPFYWIVPNVNVLLIVQALLVASSIFAVYLIAKNVVTHRGLIFAFIICFCINEGVRGVVYSDFHPECFMVPLAFFSFYFLVKRKNLLAVVSIILLLFCKEDAVFIVSTLGLFLCISERRLKVGLLLFLSGIMLWIIETKLIIPYFVTTKEYMYASFLPFGETYLDNLKAIVSDPSLLPKTIFHPKNIKYWLKLFGPLGFISLFSPQHYILFGIPLLKSAVLVNAAHTGKNMQDMTSHYVGHVFPFIFITAIYGAARLKEFIANNFKLEKRAIVNCISIIIVVLSLFFYGKTDGYKLAKFLKVANLTRTQEIRKYLKTVPKEATVAANFALIPQISHREHIYIWHPDHIDLSIDYIILDKQRLDYIPSEQVTDVEINKHVNYMLGAGYKKIFSLDNDSFVVFKKMFRVNDSRT